MIAVSAGEISSNLQTPKRLGAGPPGPAAQGSASILIVDDTPENLEVLALILRKHGYRVKAVTSGEAALVAARREPPDLVLLDVNMPEMNGFEVCERLKADDGLHGIPVIFLSALTEPLDKVKAFASGGVDYVTKPFDLTELRARVETHLKLRRLSLTLEENIAQLARANARMSRDLTSAAKIQRTFLPRAAPRIPGVGFAWAYRPCDELAGDGLNIIPLGDGTAGVYILDVSGHGVSSALLSVTLSRLLSAPSEPASILARDRSFLDALDVASPAAVADLLNRLFPFDSATEQFATLMYGVLDAAAAEFRYVSAGHPGPLHLPAGGEPVILEHPGFPIGLCDERYEERRLRLAPGDRLYLYSDGLPDANSPQGERFGETRLREAIARLRAEPLADGITTLLDDVETWRDGERPEDDISILAVEVAPVTVPFE